MTLRMRDRENMEKGLAAGRKEGLTEAVILLLRDMGELPEELREIICSEQNVDRLNELLHLAKKANTIEEFQKKM